MTPAKALAVVLVMAVLVAGCGGGRADVSMANPAGGADGGASTDPTASVEWFTDRAAETHLDFTHFNGMSGEFFFPEIMPPGVGLLDYDNDGDLDVWLVQGQRLGVGKTINDAAVRSDSQLPLKGRLYRNDLAFLPDGTRDWRFTDVTERSGIDATGYGMGVAAGDFDNDGWVDLYLTNFGSNQLFRNNRDGTFTDVTKRSGTTSNGFSVSAAFVDYDRDGWLDLFVGNYVHYTVGGGQKCRAVTGAVDYCPPQAYRAQPSRLYHNNRDGTFLDVTAAAGMAGEFGPALGVVTADFDKDGWVDIYVANDGEENQLWINQHDGTFKNTGLLSGTALSEEGKPEASMGVDAGDFDNDGDEDLFMTHLEGQGNNLYVNRGDGLFDDQSAASGLGPSSLPYTGFGTAWIDYDNDGWLDVLAVNGTIEALKERAGSAFPYDQRKLLFRNLRDGRFEDVTKQAGRAFERSAVGRGAAFGDLDNDGDMDVVVGNLNGPAELLVNEIGNRSHWVGLRLIGGRTPRDMLGARVAVIRKDAPTLWRRARADGSYGSANDPRVLVGLGGSRTVPSVRVQWPNGQHEEWSDIPIDRWTTLKEGSGR